MCHHAKCHQNRPNGFGDITIFRFLSPVRMGWLICIAAPNFIKIGQMVAEISHLTIFNMAAICHVDYLNLIF